MNLLRQLITGVVTMALSLSAGLGAPMALAQEAQGAISISPLIMELQVQRGERYEREVVVTNTFAEDYQISYESFDVSIDPDTHNVSFFPEASKRNLERSLAAWITPLSEELFVVPAGDSATFRFEVGTPVEAALQDYYASLNFYFQPLNKELQNGTVQVRQSIGCLLLVSPLEGNGDLGEEKGFEVSDLRLQKNGQETQVMVDFSNESLRFIHLKSLLTLADESGEIYFQREGKGKRVFPGETSSIEDRFPNRYLETSKDLKLTFELIDRQSGEQVALKETVLVAGIGALLSTSSPLWRGLLIAGIILLGGLAIWLSASRRKKRQ